MTELASNASSQPSGQLPSRSRAALAGAASQMRPATLTQTQKAADLQKRVDHKYLVTAAEFARLGAALTDRFHSLEIDGSRIFRYESVYFDTADLGLYRDHLQGRRRRFKVRTRTYLDSGLTLFEVKTKGHRGQTVKHRMPYPYDRRGRMDDGAHEFVAHVLSGSYGMDPPPLEASLTTRYRRGTFVDLADGSRLTCDVDLESSVGGRLECGPDRVVLESKSTGSATADRMLASWGLRPVSMSKYGIGTALLRPELPANRWNRILRREFGWQRELP